MLMLIATLDWWNAYWVGAGTTLGLIILLGIFLER
jgi:hypothetical protein